MGKPDSSCHTLFTWSNELKVPLDVETVAGGNVFFFDRFFRYGFVFRKYFLVPSPHKASFCSSLNHLRTGGSLTGVESFRGYVLRTHLGIRGFARKIRIVPRAP